MKELLLLFFMTYHSPVVDCGECWKLDYQLNGQFNAQFQGNLGFTMPKLAIFGGSGEDGCPKFTKHDEIFDTCDVRIEFGRGVTCEPLKDNGYGNQELLCYYDPSKEEAPARD